MVKFKLVSQLLVGAESIGLLEILGVLNGEMMGSSSSVWMEQEPKSNHSVFAKLIDSLHIPQWRLLHHKLSDQ